MILQLQRQPEEKIRALKVFISRSPDATRFCKKTLFWFIDQSDFLSKRVFVEFPKTCEKLGRSVSFGVHDMVSVNCRTHLDKYMRQRGMVGVFRSFSSSQGSHRIYFAEGFGYFDGAEMISYDRKAINAINLPES